MAGQVTYDCAQKMAGVVVRSQKVLRAHLAADPGLEPEAVAEKVRGWLLSALLPLIGSVSFHC